jgi:CHAD domain-containing protein
MSCDLEPPADEARAKNGRIPFRGKEDRRRSPILAFAPPAVKAPRVRPGEPAARLIHSALIGALLRIQAADPPARGGDVEGIHRLRTSTRRLRSELRTARDLIDRGRREDLERELKWIASTLGGVRDLDILIDRLHNQLCDCINMSKTGEAGLSDLEGRLAPLFRLLADRHERNSHALRAALQGDRYRRLVETIEGWIVRPPLKDDAWEPCRSLLPPLAAGAWKRLKKGAKGLSRSSPDEEFHEVRKRAKRARYAAELIAPALGGRVEKKARRFIRLTTKLQDILGEHQDAVVAAAEVERFVDENRHGPDEDAARAAQELLEGQRQAAQAARDKFFDGWDRLDRKKTTRWLKLKSRSLA